MKSRSIKTDVIRSTSYVMISIITMFVGILGVSGVLQLLYTEDVPPRTLGIVNTSVAIIDPESCGNSILESMEECDGTLLGDNSCVSLGYYGGNLKCNTNCTLNTSDCITLTTYCGNGVINAGEECDISHFGTQTCGTFGYDTGDLICNDNCTINKSDCSYIVLQAEEIIDTIPTVIPSPSIDYVYPTSDMLPETGTKSGSEEVRFNIEYLLNEPAIYIYTSWASSYYCCW